MLKAVVLLCFVCVASAVTTKELWIQRGKVLGLEGSFNGKTFYSFYGLPYAKAPVGQLRFRKPEPYGDFTDGLHNGTELGPICVQLDASFLGKGAEDCLNLNVFTTLSRSPLKPVMIYIHGGGSVVGSGQPFPGHTLSTFGDVVLVTINYRLGFFGFLPLNEDIFEPNIGLWDQHMAFQWVKDNIEDFGGDPNSITIFGQSAGANHVIQHMLSHQNNNTLFQRAIVQSGAINTFKARYSNSIYTPKSFTNLVGCRNKANAKILECLQQNTTDEISEALNQVSGSVDVGFDGDYFPKNLKSEIDALLRDPTAQNLSISEAVKAMGQYDVIVGWNSQEGLAWISSMTMDLSRGLTNAQLQNVIQFNDIKPEYAADLVESAVIQYYRSIDSTNFTSGEKNLNVMVEILGDTWFAFPMSRILQLHSLVREDNRKTYGYYYSHKRSDGWTTPSSEGPEWLKYGAAHSDEVYLLFGDAYLFENGTARDGVLMDDYLVLAANNTYTEQEKKMSDKLQKIWTAFSRTGEVAGWPQFDIKNEQLMELKVGDFKMIPAPRQQKLKYFTSLMTGISENKYQPDCSVVEGLYFSGTASLTPGEANKVMTALIVFMTILAVLFLLTLLTCIRMKIKTEKLDIDG